MRSLLNKARKFKTTKLLRFSIGILMFLSLAVIFQNCEDQESTPTKSPPSSSNTTTSSNPTSNSTNTSDPSSADTLRNAADGSTGGNPAVTATSTANGAGTGGSATDTTKQGQADTGSNGPMTITEEFVGKRVPKYEKDPTEKIDEIKNRKKSGSVLESTLEVHGLKLEITGGTPPFKCLEGPGTCQPCLPTSNPRVFVMISPMKGGSNDYRVIDKNGTTLKKQVMYRGVDIREKETLATVTQEEKEMIHYTVNSALNVTGVHLNDTVTCPQGASLTNTSGCTPIHVTSKYDDSDPEILHNDAEFIKRRISVDGKRSCIYSAPEGQWVKARQVTEANGKVIDFILDDNQPLAQNLIPIIQ